MNIASLTFQEWYDSPMDGEDIRQGLRSNGFPLWIRPRHDRFFVDKAPADMAEGFVLSMNGSELYVVTRGPFAEEILAATIKSTVTPAMARLNTRGLESLGLSEEAVHAGIFALRYTALTPRAALNLNLEPPLAELGESLAKEGLTTPERLLPRIFHYSKNPELMMLS